MKSNSSSVHLSQTDGRPDSRKDEQTDGNENRQIHRKMEG